MPRRSQWAHNGEMWEWSTRHLKGGMTYSEIQGRLAVSEKTRFGRTKIPSVDTIRYQLIKRLLRGKEVSPLPDQELEAHYRALTYLGNALRYLVDEPSTSRSGMPRPPNALDPADWRGFR